ncbi:MAG: BTAD domain-containing putative transcriptional regulator [Aestuariivirga sp.]
MTARLENNKLVKLQLLGEFSLSGSDGRPIAVTSKKNRALLAILALSAGLHATRERIAGLLWGEHGEDQARSSFRQSLAVLRKELGVAGQAVLEVRDDLIALQPDAVSIDAVEILNWANAQDLASLRASALLYSGDLLADLALREEAFEAWLSAERRRLSVAAIKLFDRLASLETGHAQIDAAQQLLALDNLRESSHRQLMKAYASQGERGLALKQFDICKKLLHDDLGVDVAEETEALKRQIMGGASDAAKTGIAANEPARRPSIAVLPFTNLGDDPAQGFFSDGVTADIITELTRWRLLSVRSGAASFRYRGPAIDLKQIGRELDVRYVVEGSVRRMGERIRITVQVTDTGTGNHVWAERFDREQAEIFAVQDQVVRTIVSTLVGRVEVAAAERASRQPPASLVAYECVLKGNALPWDDPAGAAEATRLFAKAIEIDPGYGFAHAMLAVMFYRKWVDDWSSSGEALNEAFDLAKRAVELDSNDSTCFAILGQVHLLRRSFDLAVKYAQRAVEINPNNQWNLADLGYVLVYVGEAESAVDYFNRAREIDPYFNPPWSWSCLGRAHMVLHQYKEALSAFEHSAIRDYWDCALMAGCYARLGDIERTRDRVAECLKKRPDFSISRRIVKEPFKDPADAAHLVEALHMAGLPE